MKWVDGDPISTLFDSNGERILGIVSKDTAAGFNAYDYCGESVEPVGNYPNREQAKRALETRCEAIKG